MSEITPADMGHKMMSISKLSIALSQAITMLEGDAKHGARSDDPFVRDDAAYTMQQVKRFREILENAQ